ncbi:MAG TPA: LLM class flavin-dependent oxidoreductase [Stellaceae bacterium]|nr:LLM class flavin-dependent oxidoreductase [Stellaceae bacterium]
MEFGMQFFPNVTPEEKSGAQYFDECLRLAALGDALGWGHVRTVEHYFLPYGGYSPNPIVFLTAVSQRTRAMRLVTGAVLPVFNHPLKIAGEFGMLDCISGGRVEAGFGRAFLPHEFARFGVSLDESRARFAEGMEQVRRLLEEENVTSTGRFHSFRDTTSLPRPVQKPRPRFWVAATVSPESFIETGKAGHAVMAIPLAGKHMKELIDLYRNAWRAAGHPGNGRVMLAFHMFCHEMREAAWAAAREPMHRYLKALVAAASDWSTVSSKDYAGYEKMVTELSKETIESQVASGAAWIGTPAEIADQIARYVDAVGGYDSASLQVNFNTIGYAEAERSVRLFSEKVMPLFSGR